MDTRGRSYSLVALLLGEKPIMAVSTTDSCPSHPLDAGLWYVPGTADVDLRKSGIRSFFGNSEQSIDVHFFNRIIGLGLRGTYRNLPPPAKNLRWGKVDGAVLSYNDASHGRVASTRAFISFDLL